MSTIALEILLKERDKKVSERDAAMLRFKEEIDELEAAIKKISGKHSDEIDRSVIYDDEHPDYIKASIEE